MPASSSALASSPEFLPDDAGELAVAALEAAPAVALEEAACRILPT